MCVLSAVMIGAVEEYAFFGPTPDHQAFPQFALQFAGGSIVLRFDREQNLHALRDSLSQVAFNLAPKHRIGGEVVHQGLLLVRSERASHVLALVN